MAQGAYRSKSRQAGLLSIPVRMVGTGASAPTKEVGSGFAITRVSAGLYRLTFSENPGTFVCANATLQAATPAGLAGHTLVCDTWDTTNLRLDVLMSNASDAAHDLEANEYINMIICFKTLGVS